MTASGSNTSFLLNDSSRAVRWASALAGSSELWMHGFWKFDWRDTFVKVAHSNPNPDPDQNPHPTPGLTLLHPYPSPEPNPGPNP